MADQKENFIDRLSTLSMLNLTDAEKPKASAQIDAMKRAFEIIGSKDAKNIEPLFIPNSELVTREDVVKPWEGAEDALAQVPELQGKLVKVPLVIG